MLKTLVIGSLTLYIVYRVASYFTARTTSPTRRIPGPRNGGFFLGNIPELWKSDATVVIGDWVEKYGHVMKHKMLFGRELVVVTDLKALNHVLQNGLDYQKPESARWSLRRIIGDGLVVVEGEKHKQQRKIMNPAFATAEIRQFTELFIAKSTQLRDLLHTQIQPGERACVNILSWLNKTTLDVIGLAGFNYKFDALNPSQQPNELSEAFSTLFRQSQEDRFLDIIQARYPIFRRLPAFSKRQVIMGDAKRIMSRIGKQLLDESRTALMGTGEKGDNWRARDMLSLMLRANMGSDLEEHQRMSDSDVLAQIATFLTAGHETSATGTAWAIFSLGKNLDAQTKLREELLSFPNDTPTMDELNSLPYLDAVTREALRILPPVPASIRVAMKDGVIPLDEPYTDTLGVTHDHLRVRKGTALYIPIGVVNTSKKLWGPDAREFKPERWTTIPASASSIPGVWSNLMTFLSGPRACIGFRFAVIEIKTLLFTLIRSFEFELAVPAEDIQRQRGVVERPCVRSEKKVGPQLPVFIKPYMGKEA